MSKGQLGWEDILNSQSQKDSQKSDQAEALNAPIAPASQPAPEAASSVREKKESGAGSFAQTHLRRGVAGFAFAEH